MHCCYLRTSHFEFVDLLAFIKRKLPEKVRSDIIDENTTENRISVILEQKCHFQVEADYKLYEYE